jgi:SAM-dependent methyltransferase
MDFGFSHDRCGFCGDGLGPSRYSRSDAVELLVCESCGAGRVKTELGGLQELYEGGEYFDSAEEWPEVGYAHYGDADVASRLWAPRLLELLGMGDGSSVLDVGCADGALASMFESANYLAGVEPNLAAAEKARARGVDILAEDIYRYHAEPRFDVVIGLALLEHLPEPDRALKAMASSLAPGGLLLVELPCWAGADVDPWLSTSLEHLWYPTRLSLEKLLSRSGFRWWAVREVQVVGFAETLVGVAGFGDVPAGLGGVLEVMDGVRATNGTGVFDLCFHGMYRGKLRPSHANSLRDLSQAESRYALSLMVERCLATQSLQEAYEQVVEARDYYASQADAYREARDHYAIQAEAYREARDYYATQADAYRDAPHSPDRPDSG